MELCRRFRYLQSNTPTRTKRLGRAMRLHPKSTLFGLRQAATMLPWATKKHTKTGTMRPTQMHGTRRPRQIYLSASLLTDLNWFQVPYLFGVLANRAVG